MSDYQLVLVKEAQQLSSIDALEKYLKDPLRSTILVLCYKGKKLDKRKAVTKSIEQKGELFTSEKIADYKMAPWISHYVQSLQYDIEPKACELLASHLGNDLVKVNNELQKIMINFPKATTITTQHIQNYVGIDKDFNIFEYQNALMKKERSKVYQITSYFAQHTQDMPLLVIVNFFYKLFLNLSLLHTLKDRSKDHVSKTLGIHPFFVKDYEGALKHYSLPKCIENIHLLNLYDLKSKGVDTSKSDDAGLLLELIFKLMH